MKELIRTIVMLPLPVYIELCKESCATGDSRSIIIEKALTEYFGGE